MALEFLPCGLIRMAKRWRGRIRPWATRVPIANGMEHRVIMVGLVVVLRRVLVDPRFDLAPRNAMRMS